MIIRNKQTGQASSAYIRFVNHDICDAIVVDEDGTMLDLHGCEIVKISDEERNMMPEYAYVEMEEE